MNRHPQVDQVKSIVKEWNNDDFKFDIHLEVIEQYSFQFR